MADFYIGQNDTASPLFETLEDETGAAVDIQGATINVTITPIAGGTPIVNGSANNLQVGDGSDGSRGEVSYGEGAHPWGAATATAGYYLYKWEVTYGGGTLQTFPNDGYRLLQITADAPTSVQRYASVDELKNTLNLRGTTYANQDLQFSLSAASTAIELICGRKFTAGSAPETRKYTPVSCDYCIIDDLQTTAGLAVTNNTVAMTVDLDYVLESFPGNRPNAPYSALTFGIRTSGYRYTILYPYMVRSVAVTGTFGWPTIPDPIKQATLMVAGRLLKRSREAPFGILALGDEGEAMRITRADPDVLFLLNPYMRAWVP